jgi:acyl carrier protein
MGRMTTSETDVRATITEFLQRVGKAAEFDASTRLFADGLGLDSLETAELSALLEDEHGRDPFSAGEMPQTVGEIEAFYASVA